MYSRLPIITSHTVYQCQWMLVTVSYSLLIILLIKKYQEIVYVSSYNRQTAFGGISLLNLHQNSRIVVIVVYSCTASFAV